MSVEKISVGDILIGRVHNFKKKFWVKISGSKVKIPVKHKNFNNNQLRTWRSNKILVAIKILSTEKLLGEIISAVDDSPISKIIIKHGVISKFSDGIKREAAKIEYKPSESEISRRIDRRNLEIVTIDGEDAKDLDDGVFAEKIDGGYFLGVYIADVSHYVKRGAPLDNVAFERGTSIYPVDRVVPMLPVELSNGICSLNPGVNRLAMACEMFLDLSGKVTSYKIFPTVIKVFRRLSYTQVNKFFDGETSELENCATNLQNLLAVYNLRKKIRTERGAIDFEIPELKITLDKKDRPIKITKKIRGIGEKIIEECMLAANETVAEHTCKNLIPSLYRVHENPDAEKMENFNRLLNRFNLHIPISEKIQPLQYQKVLEKIKNNPAEKVISTFALRTMQQARYSSKNLGHFGLAAQFYTHFTSPIRRYPDLIVHRMLKATREEIPKFAAKLDEIARQSSERERRAAEIEREALDLKCVEFMKGFLLQKFDAVICNVTNFGFFVELENGVDGLVPVASITDDYYNFVENEIALVGKHKGRIFQIGDKVRVQLVRADLDLRQLTFALVEGVTDDELISEV
ncbi:MAG: ribonuclease R [Selenomonadaceae bacterium]|nr:ribonuclease R [Selenomonadaceae bacterium]